jgi:uncharacterized protein YcbK (DUF882 family)
MLNQNKITRRLFLSLGVFPTVLSASPLVDIERGLGLFSPHNRLASGEALNRLNLFNDPEPELATFDQLGSNKSDNIVINKGFDLRLVNSNTKQEMSFKFPPEYRISKRELTGLDNFLKDWRTNEIKNIDTAVLASFLTVCSLCAKKNKPLKVNIHSGFRSKKTNEYLRQNSNKVAKNSMHILGKAIDFSIPGHTSRSIAKITRANTKGGVGTYPNFVHLDSGPKRSW